MTLLPWFGQICSIWRLVIVGDTFQADPDYLAEPVVDELVQLAPVLFLEADELGKSLRDLVDHVFA